MTPDIIRADSRWADGRRAESRGGKTVTWFVSLLAMVAGATASLMFAF